MIVADSSVWIGYLRGAQTWQTERLDQTLGREPLLMGDLILTEVLQGFVDEREFERARRMFEAFDFATMGGKEVAIQAARNFRKLRGLGVTVRKTVDCLIATFCIESGNDLLHDDRDFDAFEKHLGLQVVKR